MPVYTVGLNLPPEAISRSFAQSTYPNCPNGCVAGKNILAMKSSAITGLVTKKAPTDKAKTFVLAFLSMFSINITPL